MRTTDHQQTISEEFISVLLAKTPATADKLLVSVLDNSIDSLVMLKAIRDTNERVSDFEYLMVNRSAEKMLGREGKDIIGKSVLQLFPGTKEEGILNLYISTVNSGEPFDIKFFYDHDGMKNCFRQLGLRIDNELVLIITSDITRQNELLRINNDLDNFMYMASHDLKAPVHNIEGLMAALVDSLDTKLLKDENVQPIISMIQSSVNRFKKTIQDLTDVTKIYKNQSEDRDVIDIREAIEEVKLSINDLVSNGKVIIRVDTAECNELLFSKINFSSILSNLITNSIKYSFPGRIPEIKIKSSIVKDEILISFQDNGLGIASEKLDQIFTMFARLHQHVEGTGIGLFVVKRIVEGAHGRIIVASELDKGTTFNIYLKNTPKIAS